MPLLIVLAFVAGLVDVTGFLTLDQIFTAHVTGNLVLVAAGVKEGDPPAITRMLTLPVFALSLALGYLFVRRTQGRCRRSGLLLGQTLLLSLVLVLMVFGRRSPMLLLVAAMLAVAALALQCAFVRAELGVGRATTVMTGNSITLVISAMALFRPGPLPQDEARQQLRGTLPIVLAFVAGCPLGAASVASLGSAWAWAVPVLVSAVALPLASRTLTRSHAPVTRTGAEGGTGAEANAPQGAVSQLGLRHE